MGLKRFNLKLKHPNVKKNNSCYFMFNFYKDFLSDNIKNTYPITKFFCLLGRDSLRLKFYYFSLPLGIFSLKNMLEEKTLTAENGSLKGKRY